ncbi:MAG: GntR family transcriptional regulator [Candidatus Methylacidiphilales bacterium]|nr:GntR family transcriptional regulator [Candidatus Methylacidiphilales bacterium]
MSLRFSLKPAGDVPIYRQIIQEIRRAIAAEELRTGDQLPAVRTLAEELVINPNTIARSYQELVRDGVLESRHGIGVFVAQRRQIYSDAERMLRLQRAIDPLFHEAIALDFTAEEVIAAIRQRWSSSPPPSNP